MLRYLGHKVEMHPRLPLKTTLDKIHHTYLPYLADLYSPDEMRQIRVDNRYDEPFLTLLALDYFARNGQQYDSYLQRVEEIEYDVHHERQLDIMSWHDFPPVLHLVRGHYQLMDTDHEVEYHLTELFSR